MRDWLREVRFAGRLLGKSPGPAIVAVVALGLGIGLATTSFSIAWGVLFRGLPFPGGDRIMDISTRDAAHPESRRSRRRTLPRRISRARSRSRTRSATRRRGIAWRRAHRHKSSRAPRS